MIKHVNNADEFNQEIANGIVLVDFFATWCGPCKMLAPVLEEVDAEGSLPINIVKVDVDQVAPVAVKYGIQMIPTLLLFKDGKIINSTRGYMGKSQLVDFVRKSLD